ncbi:MAG: hypothetical protein ABSC60_07315 [Acidobacteriota bacterium]|jgi:hypothetical protein
MIVRTAYGSLGFFIILKILQMIFVLLFPEKLIRFEDFYRKKLGRKPKNHSIRPQGQQLILLNLRGWKPREPPVDTVPIRAMRLRDRTFLDLGVMSLIIVAWLLGYESFPSMLGKLVIGF